MNTLSGEPYPDPISDDPELEQVSEHFFGPKERSTKDDPEVDFSRLDLRVGKIVDARLHPCLPDLLYLTLVDIGESWTRPVAAQLKDHYELSDLIEKRIVLLKNSATTWYKGYDSQGEFLAARLGDKLELLNPPPEAGPGDQVIVPGFKPAPDLPFMDPELKIFETVSKFCKIDFRKHATYGDISLIVEGKEGFVTSDSIIDVPLITVDCYQNVR